jgi:hypothetical protein
MRRAALSPTQEGGGTLCSVTARFLSRGVGCIVSNRTHTAPTSARSCPVRERREQAAGRDACPLSCEPKGRCGGGKLPSGRPKHRASGAQAGWGPAA